MSVRIFNTNTQTILIETIQLDGKGHFLEEGDYRIGGVKGTGSRIKVSFIKPGGSMTGKTFPTGNREDELTVCPSSSGLPGKEPFTVRATLIDVSNPFIFVDSSSLPSEYHLSGPDSEISLRIIESIRREASVKFGFSNDPETAGLRKGTPKIGVVSTPDVSDSNVVSGGVPDIAVLAYSMGKVHPSVQLTGAVCLGAAATLQGTVVERLRLRNSDVSSLDRRKATQKQKFMDANGDCITIGHASGTIDVDVEVTEDEVTSVTVFRTARRVFEGTIFVSA